MKMSDAFTIDELLVTSDILRSMLDESISSNKILQNRIDVLESVLKEHGIPIPDYAAWHDDLPIA